MPGWRRGRTAGGLLVGALAAFTLLGRVSLAQSTDLAPPGLADPDQGVTTRGGCTNLISELNQLLGAADPEAFSATRLLAYDPLAGRVRVIAQLVAPEGNLAQAFDLAVESRYASYVQAWAPLEQLCPLAADARVGWVESPAGPALTSSAPEP